MKTRWLTGLHLALALTLPALALGEPLGNPQAARAKEEAASSPVEVIRGVSKTRAAYNSRGVSPKSGGEVNPPRRIYTVKVNNTPASNPCPSARPAPRRA